MSDVWESVWENINAACYRLSVPLSQAFPSLKWSCGHHDNKAFPFRAYATFNRGSEDAEDVVVSVDFHRPADDQLSYSADVGLDDGQILADGPSGTISTAAGLAAAVPEIRIATREIVAFITASGPLLRSALEGGLP